MSKKITLSELKVKSAIVEISAEGKKATKGGHIRDVKLTGGGRIKTTPGGNWIADTIVDIRLTTDKDTINMTP